ncbi:MAG: class I SAM-dependent methyltransferase [Planctomycetia bacterium]|nr:class I SAM-dependent methyltransferase [Planctomycetia bacterium]
MSESATDTPGTAAGWPLHLVGRAHGRTVHARRIRALAGHFAELLPARHSVLDVGCGDGRLDALIHERRPDVAIAGVDVLVRPETDIAVTPFDGERLPFPDQSFDSVMFCDVLHHVVSPLELLKEAVRVARQCVVIKDHVAEGWLARPTLRLMDFVGNAPHGVALPYNYLTSRQWDAAFEACRLMPRLVFRRLGLYPAWADLWFGRALHFAGIYDVIR